MNYQQAYNFLISLNNIPRQEYLKNKKKTGIYLKRLQFLLDILGNPEKKIPHYIHITGTSGKGSVAIMIASILHAANKKTGLLTSPHPSVITERWEINGRSMPKKNFVQMVEKIKPALEKYINTSPYDFPSFFEIITAMGLTYFAQQKIEWAVIEVGLGGKNDSTNIIPNKDLAIITNIGMDHVDLIGPTKANIAQEKSGIIKPGCQVLTAENDKNILRLIEIQAKKQKVKIKKLNDSMVSYQIIKTRQSGTDFNYRQVAYHLPVLGEHQIKNAILAIEAGKILNLDEQTIKRGLEQARYPLRLEIFHQNPLIILDGAHNPEKMRTTISTIKSLWGIKKINLIIGFSADKNIRQMIKQLAALHPHHIACTRSTANPFRKVADPRLMQQLAKKNIPTAQSKIFLDPQTAFLWSQKMTKKNEILLITGSIFLSGELRRN